MWLDIKVHDSWKEFLTDSNIRLIDNIEHEAGLDYTPDEDKVMRFMTLDLNKIKIIILGQDPYKPAGVANGRAFQPSDLESWTKPFRQVSLKNIVRAIYAVHNNITEYSDIPNYSDIAKEIYNGDFYIKEPKDWFNSIEEQGVLLLNTSLTCRIGESNSHKHLWVEFNKRLLDYIRRKRPDIIWFLWGKEAIDKLKYLNRDAKVYTSNHPMMCSESYKEDFLKNPCFRETKNIINWLG